MADYNWIDGKDFSIRHFYLMDRWLLAMIFKDFEDREPESLGEHARTLGTLLDRHPDLVFVIRKRAPEASGAVDILLSIAEKDISDEALRAREIELMELLETDVVYTEPDIMQKNCNYIYAWDEEHLHALCDLKGKTVLDLGAGTGRLTFAASKVAKRVYASEPVDRLREHMRDRVAKEGITNVKVQDGIVMDIPHEDDTFDVVMCGHVVGDDYDAEVREMTRVCKPGGHLVICNGDDDIKRSKPNRKLIERGFEPHYHESSQKGDIYNYTKKV